MFTQETFDILVENHLNDSKIWYDEHKPLIRELVQEPFFKLIGALSDTMLGIDPEIVVEPKVDRTLSRVYRDTRYSKNKSRYRDSMWLYFRRDKRMYPGYPSFYFEINPVEIWWGCGLYLRDPETRDAYIKMVLDRDPMFLKAKGAYEGQSTYALAEGSRYKRSKHPDEPEDIRHWLDLRGVYLEHVEGDISVTFEESLVDLLKRDFEIAAPMYEFFRAACERRAY